MTLSTGWRRAEWLALGATIPAFYLALLSTGRLVSAGLYGVASVTCAAAWWFETRRVHPDPMSRQRHLIGAALAVVLLLSAVLPAGDSAAVVTVRLCAAALVTVRIAESIRPWFWTSELPKLLFLALGVFGLCGLGFWWLEPHARTFDEGLWLAFTTAATVGYGDIVPSTAGSKIFAVFVVLLGLSVLSLVTAAIAAMWVQTEERRIEQEILHDLHRQLNSIRHELTELRREVRQSPD